MRQAQRRSKIIEMLENNNTVLIQDMVQATGASEATIRRDVVYLESLGVLKRFWGGVQRLDTPASTRKTNLQHFKTRSDLDTIGFLAASQLQDNQLVFIGSGMTTLSMIPHINHRVFVVTNGIPQLEALNKKGIRALLLCGFFKEYSRSLVGKDTLDMLAKYRFDNAFLGAHGIDDKLNLLSADEYEQSIKKICIKQSSRTYLLADKSKFSSTAYYSLPAGEAKEVVIITNARPSASQEWVEEGGGFFGKIEDLLKSKTRSTNQNERKSINETLNDDNYDQLFD